MCGKVGLYRNNCPDCKTEKTESPVQVNFYAFWMPLTIAVKIAGIKGIACIDTAVRTSIGGMGLLKLLQEKGVNFMKISTSIILVDRSKKEQKCSSTVVDIELGHWTFDIEMLALRSAEDNEPF